MHSLRGGVVWRCGGLAPLPPRGGVRTAHRGVHLWLALRRERGAQQVERVAGNGGGRARQRATAAAAAAAAGGAGHGRGKGVSAAPGAHCPAPHPHTHTRSPEKGDADLCGDAPPRRCCLALLQHHKLDRGVGYGEQLARHGAAPEALRRWRRVGAGGSAWRPCASAPRLAAAAPAPPAPAPPPPARSCPAPGASRCTWRAPRPPAAPAAPET